MRDDWTSQEPFGRTEGSGELGFQNILPLGEAAGNQVATTALGDQGHLMFWGRKVCGFCPSSVKYFMQQQTKCAFPN